MSLGNINAKLLVLSAAVGSASVVSDRSYEHTYLQIPSMASGTNIDISASWDGTNFYQLRKEPFATTTAQAWTYSVGASCMANGALVPIPHGFVGYKIVCTDSNPAAAGNFYIVNHN